MKTYSPRSIRVLLVDDHDVVRLGLRMMINSQPHMEIVGEAINRDEALQFAADTDPDIILLDVDLDGEDAIEVLPNLFAAAQRAHILLITGARNSEDQRRAVRLGAKGVVFKARAMDTVVPAIERIHGGGYWLDPALIAEVLNDLARPPQTNGTASKNASISPREREVVELVCKGLRNQQIADKLAISEATVRHHLTSIFSKLNITTRAELIVYAYETGLLPPPKS